jgi:hypothetical protein
VQFLAELCSLGEAGMTAPGLEFDEERRKRFAAAIKKHLHVHELSRKLLIRSDLSVKTIDNALSGKHLSQATVDKIESILKTKFEDDLKGQFSEQADIFSDKADDALGGYTLRAVEYLQGDYVFIRPTFKNPSVISAYLIEVRWDEFEGCLVFSETQRSDAKYAQKGKVYVPFGRPFLNFVTISTGGVRLAIVSMPENGIMRGIITTVHNPMGTSFVPASSPVAMFKVTEPNINELGQITSENPKYLEYKRLLDEVISDQFGLMVSGVEFVDRRRGLTVVV